MRKWINKKLNEWAKRRVVKLLSASESEDYKWYSFLILLNNFNNEGIGILEETLKIKCFEIEIIEIPTQTVQMEFICTNTKLIDAYSMMQKSGVLEECSLDWAKRELSPYRFEALIDNLHTKICKNGR